ncbi:MAG: hypothetical protein WB791_03510 [Waddliaceae bacterium]
MAKVAAGVGALGAFIAARTATIAIAGLGTALGIMGSPVLAFHKMGKSLGTREGLKAAGKAGLEAFKTDLPNWIKKTTTFAAATGQGLNAISGSLCQYAGMKTIAAGVEKFGPKCEKVLATAGTAAGLTAGAAAMTNKVFWIASLTAGAFACLAGVLRSDLITPKPLENPE